VWSPIRECCFLYPNSSYPQTTLRNPEKVTKIVTSLNLKVLPRDLNSKNPRHLLSVIFSQWLPLATCTVQAVIDIVPPPNVAQKTRLPKIVYPDLSEETVEPKNKLEKELWACDATEDAYVVAYVSKMFAVKKKETPEYKSMAREEVTSQPYGTQDEDAEDDEVLLGFSRLYSGKLRVGSRICAILPKYDASKPPSNPRNSKYISMLTIQSLYTMMGRDLVPVKEVVAGNVFAVAGLEGFVGRSATLCSPSAAGFGEDVAIKKSLDSSPDAQCIINLGRINQQV
jgi:ribosome assembly protein 1